jgi:hypothetical protein
MEVLDDDWLTAAIAALDGLDASGVADIVVAYVVTGTPVGKATVVVKVENGRIADVTREPVPDPDLVITSKHEAAVRILTGEMSSDAGFMNGDLKVEGAHHRWLLEMRPLRTAMLDALISAGIVGARAVP